MSIRTTVTLDDDVIERVRDESRSRQVPFRQALNELVRDGLVLRSQMAMRKPFKVKATSVGLRPGFSYDDVGALNEFIDGPTYL